MYAMYSSAAKVVPECLSSPSHVLITKSSKKAMDSSANSDLLIKPLDNPSVLSPPDDTIKPMILTFDQKIRLNPGWINASAADHLASEGAIISTADDKRQVISSSADQASASPEGELWPKNTELDDRPSSPSAAQVIREPAYHVFPKQSELGDHPPSPNESEKAQVIREPASLLPKQTGLHCVRPSSPESEEMQKIREPANCSSSPPYPNALKPRMQVITEADYELANQAQTRSDEPKTQMVSDTGYLASMRGNKPSGPMKEGYMSPGRGRLSRVVEESESFSRREFAANELHYMSTHSSANHAANLSNLSSYTHSNFKSRHPSYHHNNHPNFSYNHSSHLPPNFMNSKSAPAGSAATMNSAFALFRRGSSEGGKLHVPYRRPKSNKPRSLGHTLLWPFLKIRNGYVGCMMGIDGSGDLSGMAQGGTYATRARYFADVPLSKTDSRNHG